MDRKQQSAAAILVACMVLCGSISSGDATGGGVGGGCALSTIVVTQSGTGEWAHGQPVYVATVRNACRSCARSDVKVACDGFDTTLAVDPAKLKQVSGGVCLVNGGAPMAPEQGVTFRYASSRQFGFRPVSATVAC